MKLIKKKKENESQSTKHKKSIRRSTHTGRSIIHVYSYTRIYTSREDSRGFFREKIIKGMKMSFATTGPICPPLTVIRGRSSINLVCIYRMGQKKRECNGTRVPENRAHTLTRTMFSDLRFTVDVRNVVRFPKDINQLFRTPISTCSGAIFRSLSFPSLPVDEWMLATIVYIWFIKGQ